MEPRLAKHLVKQYLGVCFCFFAGIAFLFWVFMWSTLNQQGQLLLTRDAGVPLEIGLFSLFGLKLIYDGIKNTYRMLKNRGEDT